MLTKIFLDTNIVLDMMDKNRANHTKSLKLLEISILQNIKFFISEDMLSTIYYISSDKAYALMFFDKMIQKWSIVPFGKQVIKDALELSQNNNSDLEDTLQCICAKANGCEALLTQDKRFLDCGLKVLSYEEFFSSLVASTNTK